MEKLFKVIIFGIIALAVVLPVTADESLLSYSGDFPLTIGTGIPMHVLWQPTGDMIAVRDYTQIKLYGADGEFLKTIQQEHVESLAWSPDGTQLAVLSRAAHRDWVLHIWNVETMQSVLTLGEADRPLYNLTVVWSPDGTRFAIGVVEEIQIYDANTGQRLMLLDNGGTEVSSVDWSPDGSKIAAPGWPSVNIWNADTGDLIGVLESVEIFDIVEWSPDSSYLATNTGEHLQDIVIWDVISLQAIGQLEGHAAAVSSLVWHSNGLASSAFDTTIRIWNPNTHQILQVIETGATSITTFSSVDWNPDGTKIAYINREGLLQINPIRPAQN